LTAQTPDYVTANWNEQWDELNMFISNGFNQTWANGWDQIYEPEMLPKPGERDPADLVLRRTTLLLAHLKTLPGFSDYATLESQLNTLTAQAGTVPVTNLTERKNLYLQACGVRRQIAFKNPLLDFSDILYCRYSRELPQINHGPYAAHATKPGGGIYKLQNAFSNNPVERNLLANSVVQNGRLQGQKLVPGSFRDIELSYDAKTIYFAFGEVAGGKGNPAPYNDASLDYTGYYHVYKADVDGSNLTMLTDNRIFDEHSPCELPDGRIVFLSGARNSGQRCWGNHPANSSNLYSMKSDGSDIICLNYHETNQWEPSVNHDGMLVYTQWDYIDKDAWLSQAFWICNPDGTDPRSPHANYASGRGFVNIGYSLTEAGWWVPKAEMTIRAIPGSQTYSAVSCDHHQGLFGPIINMDTRISEYDPDRPQLKQITMGEYHRTPFPLSERFYLSANKPSHEPIGGYSKWDGWDQNVGLFLVDCFGNKEILYKGTGLAPCDPFPLKAREKPPVIPSRTFQGERAGQPGHRKATVSIMNVYITDEHGKLPEGVKIKELRLIQIVPFLKGDKDAYATGYAHTNMGRFILGTVPVEEDGSVYFEAPVEIEFYMQLLDENGMAVQSMRAGAFVHPGEHLSCTGCHENKWEAIPVNPNPLAMQRLPSRIQPELEGSAPFHFVRLVQPVLDAKCQPCHAQQNALDLSGNTGTDALAQKYSWSQSYWNLRDYAFWFEQWQSHPLNTSNPYAQRPSPAQHLSRTTPGKFGALGSRLYQDRYLGSSHYNVNLTAEELRRITLWLDANSNFHSVDFSLEQQSAGEVVWPLGDVDPLNPTGVEKDYPVVPVREQGGTVISERRPELTVHNRYLQYTLSASSRVRIEAFNTVGSRIAVKDGPSEKGGHVLRWHDDSPMGTMYIFRMTAGKNVISQKYIRF
jgi:hypothetical protein